MAAKVVKNWVRRRPACKIRKRDACEPKAGRLRTQLTITR